MMPGKFVPQLLEAQCRFEIARGTQEGHHLTKRARRHLSTTRCFVDQRTENIHTARRVRPSVDEQGGQRFIGIPPDQLGAASRQGVLEARLLFQFAFDRLTMRPCSYDDDAFARAEALVNEAGYLVAEKPVVFIKLNRMLTHRITRLYSSVAVRNLGRLDAKLIGMLKSQGRRAARRLCAPFRRSYALVCICPFDIMWDRFFRVTDRRRRPDRPMPSDAVPVATGQDLQDGRVRAAPGASTGRAGAARSPCRAARAVRRST